MEKKKIVKSFCWLFFLGFFTLGFNQSFWNNWFKKDETGSIEQDTQTVWSKKVSLTYLDSLNRGRELYLTAVPKRQIQSNEEDIAEQPAPGNGQVKGY